MRESGTQSLRNVSSTVFVYSGEGLVPSGDPEDTGKVL
jgi:hypothetical protein